MSCCGVIRHQGVMLRCHNLTSWYPMTSRNRVTRWRHGVMRCHGITWRVDVMSCCQRTSSDHVVLLCHVKSQKTYIFLHWECLWGDVTRAHDTVTLRLHSPDTESLTLALKCYAFKMKKKSVRRSMGFIQWKCVSVSVGGLSSSLSAACFRRCASAAAAERRLRPVHTHATKHDRERQDRFLSLLDVLGPGAVLRGWS